jgi:hypothetical protein
VVELSYRETWALIHGIVLGSFFLVAFSGGIAEMWNLRAANGGDASRVATRIRRVQIGTVLMAIVAWATVFVGTFIVYPWYREDTPDSARSQLLADPDTKDWHEFGMEWKEHVAWISPLLATAVAVGAVLYGPRLATDNLFRRIMMGLFVLAFLIVVVAGLFGALITKAAPVT